MFGAGRCVAWTVCLGAALGAALTVDAQTIPLDSHLAVAVEVAPGLIVPETGSSEVNATFTVDCAWSSTPLGESVVTVRPVAMPDLYVQGPRTVTMPGCMAGATTASMSVSYFVTANRRAPGLQAIACRLEAEVSAGTSVSTGGHANATFAVTVDYLPLIQAQVASRTILTAPGEPARFDVVVKNFGNAQTKVTFALADEPTDGWVIDLPEPLVLDSPSGAVANVTAVLTVTGSGDGAFTNKEMPLTLVLTPLAAADGTKVGDKVSVNLTARVRGTPDAGPLLGIVLLTAAAVARRRA
ncbi:MAG: hypothetical protein ABR562_00805 [Thermoplasmatota archaeon]